MQLFDAAAIRERLSMRAAIDALATGFRDVGPSAGPLRTHVDTAAGTLLLMPASGAGGVGVKLVTLTPDNAARSLPFVNAVYVLFDPASQTPEAVLDGAALTALRTAAVSGLATDRLANPDARRLVIFGAGVQARAHLEAMLAVRSVEEVTIVSRTPGPAERLAEAARERGVDASVGGAGAVSRADLVCTCTTSDTPLFQGNRLEAGAHVNAVGSYRPTTRELDTRAMERARVVVESRDAAFEEAGELVIPINAGAFGPEHVVADLSELVRGADVRTSPSDVTVFKSVGLAFEDLIVARAVVVAA